jgi:Ca2+-binding EF-hand superfamily protein
MKIYKLFKIFDSNMDGIFSTDELTAHDKHDEFGIEAQIWRPR